MRENSARNDPSGLPTIPRPPLDISLWSNSVNDLMTKASLSAPRRRLLETMQRLNFGRIEDLEIRKGEPVFNPAPRIIQDIKLGGENGPRPELDRSDFVLKSQVAEFFDYLSRLGDGLVESIEVKHGLPFKLVIEMAD
jgi:hypothetical protein